MKRVECCRMRLRRLELSLSKKMAEVPGFGSANQGLLDANNRTTGRHLRSTSRADEELGRVLSPAPSELRGCPPCWPCGGPASKRGVNRRAPSPSYCGRERCHHAPKASSVRIFCALSNPDQFLGLLTPPPLSQAARSPATGLRGPVRRAVGLVRGEGALPRPCTTAAVHASRVGARTRGARAKKGPSVAGT
jgi:hypothetical protein